MSQIFVSFHNYAAKRRLFFGSFLLIVIALSVFMLTRLKLQEDVTAIIPDDERINQISRVLGSSRFADQLIITFTMKDKGAKPEHLINAAGYVVEKLWEDSTLIRSIQFRSGGGQFMEVYDFIYDNLPLYLEEADYERLEEMLAPEAIEKTLERHYNSLSSLMGVFTKDFIFKDPLNITPLALQRLEKFQLDDNFIIYDGCIFTQDLKHLLVFVHPAYPSSNTKENTLLVTKIDESIAKAFAEFADIDISYYGGTAVAVANAQRIKHDIILTVSVALFLLFFLFYFVFRRIKNILLIFLPIALGILAAMGIMVATGEEISAIALGVGAILIGISLDYSLHAFTHLRNTGSVMQTLKGIGKPIVMSCLSTASAFMTLFIVQSKALNQLGMFASLAIIITALMVLLLMPFLLKYVRFTTAQKQVKETLLDKIAAYSFENNKYLIFLIAGLSIVFWFTSKRLGFNSDIASLNYMPPHLVQAEEKLNSISSQAQSAVFFIAQGQTYEEALAKTEKSKPLFKEALNENLISSVSIPTELMPSRELQKERIERWRLFWSEERQAEVIENLQQKGKHFNFHEKAFSRFFLLIEKQFQSRPFEDFEIIRQSFLNNYFSEDDGLYTAVSIAKASQENKDALFDVFDGHDDLVIFDNQYFTNSFLDVLKDDFRLLVLLSMLVVFTVLMVFFGRIEIALMTFFPVLLSWLWTVGLMGLFGITFNIFNIIISTFILGLGVDYSIFIMSGLLNRYKNGSGTLAPYKLSVLLSAMTTVLCLGVLVFARHPALQSIAVVSIAGIISVIIITNTVLPLMFRFVTSNKGVRREEPVTFLNFSTSIITLFVFVLGAVLGSVSLLIIRLLPARKAFKQYLAHVVICWLSRIIVYMNITIKKTYVNKEKLNFSSPVVFVSNHQSHLDLVLLFLVNPKIVALTNYWVWRSPFFGHIVRYAGFFPAFKGLDYGVDKLADKVSQGYSVLIFPEGSRGTDDNIRRFHQGAFYLADKLNIDIQPIFIHGAMQALKKNEFFLRMTQITLTFYDRIKVQPADVDKGETYRQQTKALTNFYREEYAQIKKTLETPKFFKYRLISQYIYKGPILEWYMRVKLKLENYYDFFHKQLPGKGNILDIGCGYGFMTYMLSFLSQERHITGIDYDEEKIRTANNCPAKNDKISFVAADIFSYSMSMYDAIILSDVLHYFNEEKQEQLIEKCIRHLNTGGRLIIRDADSALKKRHLGTRYTEFFSTKTGFNKMKERRLFFTSREKITAIVERHNLKIEVVDNTKLTSNLTFIIQK